MSVINSVLKNLEHEPAAFTPLELQSIPVGKKRKLSPFILGIGIGLLFFSILAAAYLVNERINKQLPESNLNLGESIEESIPPLINPVPELKASDLSVETAYKIIGIQINEKNDVFVLEFQISQAAQSFLLETAKNRYVFLLKNASAEIEPPVFRKNKWLKNVTFNEVEDGLEISFEVLEHVTTETLYDHKEQQFYWTIRLTKHETQAISAVPDKKNDVKDNKDKESGRENERKEKIAPVKSGSIISDTVKEPIDQSVKLNIKPVTQLKSDSDRLKDARQLMAEGKVITAKKSLQGLLGSKVDEQTRVQLLDVLAKLKDDRQRNKLLTDSLTAYPQNKVFMLLKANNLFQEKNYEELINVFKGSNDDPGLVNLLAVSYQRLGRHEEAIEHYKKVLRLNPSQSKLWVSLAISQQQSGKNDAALKSFKVAKQMGGMNQSVNDFIDQRLRQLNGLTGGN